MKRYVLVPIVAAAAVAGVLPMQSLPASASVATARAAAPVDGVVWGTDARIDRWDTSAGGWASRELHGPVSVDGGFLISGERLAAVPPLDPLAITAATRFMSSSGVLSGWQILGAAGVYSYAPIVTADSAGNGWAMWDEMPYLPDGNVRNGDNTTKVAQWVDGVWQPATTLESNGAEITNPGGFLVPAAGGRVYAGWVTSVTGPVVHRWDGSAWSAAIVDAGDGMWRPAYGVHTALGADLISAGVGEVGGVERFGLKVLARDAVVWPAVTLLGAGALTEDNIRPGAVVVSGDTAYFALSGYNDGSDKFRNYIVSYRAGAFEVLYRGPLTYDAPVSLAVSGGRLLAVWARYTDSRYAASSLLSMVRPLSGGDWSPTTVVIAAVLGLMPDSARLAPVTGGVMALIPTGECVDAECNSQTDWLISSVWNGAGWSTPVNASDRIPERSTSAFATLATKGRVVLMGHTQLVQDGADYRSSSFLRRGTVGLGLRKPPASARIGYGMRIVPADASATLVSTTPGVCAANRSAVAFLAAGSCVLTVSTSGVVSASYTVKVSATAPVTRQTALRTRVIRFEPGAGSVALTAEQKAAVRGAKVASRGTVEWVFIGDAIPVKATAAARRAASALAKKRVELVAAYFGAVPIGLTPSPTAAPLNWYLKKGGSTAKGTSDTVTVALLPR